MSKKPRTLEPLQPGPSDDGEAILARREMLIGKMKRNLAGVASTVFAATACPCLNVGVVCDVDVGNCLDPVPDGGRANNRDGGLDGGKHD